MRVTIAHAMLRDAMDLIHKIVRRLLRDDDVDFSRNRNFEAYEDPMVKRALRIYRHLRSVEDDLLAAGDGPIELEAVEESADGVVVRLSYAAGRGHRESYLTTREWRMLLESERVSSILERLLDAAPAPIRESLEGVERDDAESVGR